MEGFMILAPRGTTLSRFFVNLEKSDSKDLNFYLVDDDKFDKRIVIEKNDGRVYVYRMVDSYSLEVDYAPEEVEKIHQIVPEPVLFGADYNSLSLGKEVVGIIANEPDLVVDNDFGTILRGTDFVQRISVEPDWDWRPSSEDVEASLKNSAKDNENGEDPT